MSSSGKSQTPEENAPAELPAHILPLPRRRLVQIYPTHIVMASKPVWVFQEFRSILTCRSARFVDESDGDKTDCNGEARETEPVSESAIDAVAIV